MIWNYFKQIVELIHFLIQGKNVLPQSISVFEALVDAIIPGTGGASGTQASVNENGALSLHTDQFQIYILNHFVTFNLVFINVQIYLVNIIAALLNEAARQLIAQGKNEKPANPAIALEKGIFAALHPKDRFRVIRLLERLEVNLANLPIPLRNNPGVVLAAVSTLTMLVTSGYYSEWPGYGSSRFETPEERKMEQFPTSWKQVGYPGPSLGYHAFRGYLTDNLTE